MPPKAVSSSTIDQKSFSGAFCIGGTVVMWAAAGERQETSLTQSLNPFQFSHNVFSKIKDTNNAYFVHLMDLKLFRGVDILLHKDAGGGAACMHACMHAGLHAAPRMYACVHACMHACTHVSSMRTCVQSMHATQCISMRMHAIGNALHYNKTFSNGCLGSRIDEGRSKMRYAL